MMNRKIPAATIARTVVLALALVNQLLSQASRCCPSTAPA